MEFSGTKNFSPSEVTCRCGCGRMPDAEFMVKVQWLRDMVGFSLPVASGARCPVHNQNVSSTGANGPHTTGRAIDLRVSGKQARTVMQAAMELGLTGIGVAQRGPHADRFIHIDDLPDAPGQPRPWAWSY